MNPAFASPEATDVRDKQTAHTARRAPWKAPGGEELLPGQAEAPYKDMFILYLSFRKETASLCAENHLHCKSSTRGSNRPPHDEPQRKSRSNAGRFELTNGG